MQDTCNIDLTSNINNKIIEIFEDEGILCDFLGFRVMKKCMNFRINLKIVMNEIDISENQEILHDSLNLRDIFE